MNPDRSLTGSPNFELKSGNEHQEVTWPAPRIHGTSVQMVFDDSQNGTQPAIYRRLEDAFADLSIHDSPRIVDANYVPKSKPGVEYVWKISTSNWEAGYIVDGEYQPLKKYHLTLRRRDQSGEEFELKKPAVSCAITVMPQIEGLQRADGGSFPIPYGTGTRIQLQTSFVDDKSDFVDRVVGALRDVLPASAPAAVDRTNIVADSKRILKAETYYRFDITKKNPVQKSIEHSVNLIHLGGDTTIVHEKERQPQGWVEQKTRSDGWHHLGIPNSQVERRLKLYHAHGWESFSEDHPAHHPKLEARFHGAEGTHPHLDQWSTILQRLRELIIVHAEFVGLTTDDLVADDYFDPASQPPCSVNVPLGREDDLQRYYDEIEIRVLEAALDNRGPIYDILSLVWERPRGYKDLVERTGYTKSNIQHHVGNLRDWGILQTPKKPALVQFVTDEVKDRIGTLLEEKIAPYFGELTLSERKNGRQQRAKERRERRETDADDSSEEGEE